MTLLALALAAMSGFAASSACAQADLQFDEEAPVYFKADTLEYDENGQIITAIGRVELVQEGQTLRADRIVHNLVLDRVEAQGNVVLTDPQGDTYFAQRLELQNKMKDGFVSELNAMLADGSRFTAGQGTRENGTVLTMKEATYTPCEPCEDNPDAPPVWQLVAEEVKHDKEDARISYRDARFELGGVPLAYTPYFAHADGSVKRKSGFLTPRLRFDSELGTGYQQEYYYSIAPDKDLTVGALVATDVAPVLSAEYRQRFEDAHVRFDMSSTYSERTETSNGVSEIIDDEFRGHIDGEAQWDMNENWRSGINILAASDDQYMNQYDVTSQDVLENEIYAERFDDRHYAVIRAMAFQDIRTSDRRVDQPGVLPEIKASFTGAPNATFGGRWNVDMTTLGLYREGNNQDVGRTTLNAGWERRFIHSSGLVSRAEVSARGDAYTSQDRDITNGQGDDGEGSAVRGFAQAHFQTSYPVVRNFDNGQLVLEPIAAVTTGTNVDDDADIPNEDSQDVYLSSLKLFEPNRFSGYDRIEDKSRGTYGLRSAYYTNNGYGGEVFFGQSRRFEDQNNPFPEGSGLSEQNSDYVGHVRAQFGSNFDASYRFQLAESNFASRRHEVDASTSIGPVYMYGRYFYADQIAGSDIEESREQALASTRIKLDENWEVHGAVQYDLGENEGLRRARYGVDYLGQCITLSLTGERTLTRDSSGDSGTEVFLRVGFKNLGEFETSAFTIGGDSDEDDDETDDFDQVTNSNP